jgi:HK97 family phage major capsid protein
MSFATTEKVKAGFEAAKGRIDEIDMRSQETAECVNVLQSKLRKTVGMINSSALPDSGGQFGVWANEDHAMRFGKCVLAALGREKDMGEITNVGGGILVPDELSTRFIDLLPKYGKFRANATVLPIGGGKTFIPEISSDMVVYSPAEGGTITPSDVGMGQVQLLPKTLACLAAVSNELDEDSVMAVGIILGVSIARSMAKNEDLAGFLGDGTSTYFGYKGIVGAFHSVSDTISEIAGLKVGSDNAWSGLTLQDFRDLISLLPSEFDENAKFYCAKRFYNSVMWKLAEAAGVAGIYEILSDKKVRSFLGYPVEFVNVLPVAEANSQICCILGDLSQGAYLGQKKELTIQSSDHVYFAKNQKGIRAIERIDFNVFGVGGKTNPGPIVGLITAAS